MLYASFYKNIKSPRSSYQNDSLEKETLLIFVLLLDVYLLADVRSFVGCLFAVCRLSVGRLSADCRPSSLWGSCPSIFSMSDTKGFKGKNKNHEHLTKNNSESLLRSKQSKIPLTEQQDCFVGLKE